MTLRQVTPLLALFALAGCGFFGDSDGGGAAKPDITSFTATPSTISAPGESVLLEWTVSGAVTGLEIDQGVGGVSGSSVTVTPTATTVYTLTARNSSGDDTAPTTVTLGGTTPPPPPTGDVTPPTGDFSVSESPDGPFTSDRGEDIESPDDERVVKLEPGDTFYARVAYSDPSGIAAVRIRLNNRSPVGLAADLVQGQSVGGFTLVGPVGDCDLAARLTSLTCVFEIDVGDDVVNIDQLEGAGDEFAYVFRTYVTDTAGNESNMPPRGYVTVGEAGGGPAPEPDDNEAPTAAFEVTSGDTPGLSFTFDASGSSDPDGDLLSYAWEFGDGDTASGEIITHSYDEAGSYEVTLTVTDPDGLSDTASEDLEASDDAAPGEGDAAPVLESFLVNGELDIMVAEGDDLTFTWDLSGGEPASLLLTEDTGDGTTEEYEVPDEAGSYTLEATETASYTLFATNVEGEDVAEVSVTVE